MSFLHEIFTWWHGQTIGTRLFTWRKGKLVGKDMQGNRYYQSKDGGDRRWVIYNGDVEASRVPVEWHGWLHHTVDMLPTDENYQMKDWEMPHRPNPTGTAAAYRPQGSLHKSGVRPSATGDYEPWRP